MPKEISTRSVAAKAEATATASAYAAGQVVGGLLTCKAVGSANALHLPQSGLVVNLALADYAKQSLAVDVVIFHSQPAGPFADKGAFTPSTADLKLIAGVVSVLTTDFAAFAANSLATKQPLKIEVQNIGPAGGDQNVYALLVARGATNPGAGAAYQLTLGIVQD